MSAKGNRRVRVAIFGNSGSGKTTRARELARGGEIPVLDLDTIVWEPGRVAVRRSPEAVLADLARFCSTHDDWIVEGCYGDPIREAFHWKPELLFMNPGEEACLRNCINRPWEPHKYASKAEQDEKLEHLREWVSDYYRRDGDMSLSGHRAIFDAYDGPKREDSSAGA